MPVVAIMEFDKTSRLFQFLKEIDISGTPSSGDKIVFDIDGIGYVFDVYDVHYSENHRTDVNVIRRSTITEYNSSKFPDIS
jgi:hypothetical protein